MNSEGVKPDRLTLLYIFQGLSNFNIQANLPIALAILAEFKILDIRPCLGKFFTYVTKTRPNLSTYSWKPRNYNGTVIFQIDNCHEKVLPNQLKSLSNLIFSQMFWLFGLFLFTLKVTESNSWFWHWQKCEFWIDWVRHFHCINLKNTGAIVIPPFSTICGQVQANFGNIGKKFTD